MSNQFNVSVRNNVIVNVSNLRIIIHIYFKFHSIEKLRLLRHEIPRIYFIIACEEKRKDAPSLYSHIRDLK